MSFPSSSYELGALPRKRESTDEHPADVRSITSIETKGVTRIADAESQLPRHDYLRRDSASIKDVRDTTHRRLKARHIQLIGIGGTIGTALYVQIGQVLLEGGPGSLFIAFAFW